MNIYQNILESIKLKEKLLAVLIDPDKFEIKNSHRFIGKVNASIATHIFVGGSIVHEDVTQTLVAQIKKDTNLPVVLFPGDVTQITEDADGLLFLSLLSGRNPDYLIGKHIEAVSKLKHSNLELIPTGYVLVDGGCVTAIEKVTGEKSMSRHDIDKIVNTTIAGQLLGMKLIYLEAGSGAKLPLTSIIIGKVKNELQIPLIVGGGIKSLKQLESAYSAGADLVVIGTVFEENESFFNELIKEE